MHAVDTNVLLYAHNPRDATKQATAVSLIRSLTNGALLWQDIRDLRRVWITILPGWGVLDEAEKLLTSYSLSFWDAMIIAACLEGGISRLYSEDFDAYSQVNGLEIVNPFKEP